MCGWVGECGCGCVWGYWKEKREAIVHVVKSAVHSGTLAHGETDTVLIYHYTNAYWPGYLDNEVNGVTSVAYFNTWWGSYTFIVGRT